jgi:RHS repeat-associated protein
MERNIDGRNSSSKERDAETGLDYFGARYYSGAEGRFTSPDPKASSARLENPQRWNRYTYALNNPIIYIDPDGKEVKVYTEQLGTANLGGGIRGFIGSLYRPRHTFMRVTTPTEDVTLELGGPTPKTAPYGNPIKKHVEPGYNAYKDNGRKNVEEASVKRPDGVGPNDYSFENNILEAFDETTINLPVYNGYGPNSNGFIQYLIESSGGQVALPSKAVAHDDTKSYKYYDDPDIQRIRREYDLPMMNNESQRALEMYNSNFNVVWN